MGQNTSKLGLAKLAGWAGAAGLAGFGLYHLVALALPHAATAASSGAAAAAGTAAAGATATAAGAAASGAAAAGAGAASAGAGAAAAGSGASTGLASAASAKGAPLAMVLGIAIGVTLLVVVLAFMARNYLQQVHARSSRRHAALAAQREEATLASLTGHLCAAAGAQGARAV